MAASPPSAAPASTAPASACAIAARLSLSSESPSSTNSMAARGLAATSCSTWAIFNAAGRSMSPLSACNSPSMAANRLDLPEPLAPVSPTLSPRKTVNSACSKSGSGPRRRVRSRADNTGVGLRGQPHRPRTHGRAQRRVMGRAAGLAGENGEHLARFHGIAEQTSLGVVAGGLAQEFELLARLDSLGDDLEIEALAHVDDGADDGRVVRVHGDVANEGLIDFQSADRELLQGRQRGIPGAEIVDGQIQTHGVQLVEKTDGALGVRHQGGFGDFQLETGGRNLVLAEYVAAA